MSNCSRKTKRPAATGGPAKAAKPTAGWGIALLKAASIAAAGFWVFAPALHGEWFEDDKFYLSGNPLMNDPHHLWKICFMPGSFIEYYPITQTVQAIQWRLWHTDSFGYVMTNVVLHIVNGLLIWLLLRKFNLRFAWLGGLLFVIHPMAVESVAWISELKNTLSLAPFLLAICAWIDYEKNENQRDYWLALGLFLAAMLCKITMSPFPVAILLYSWWKRGRIAWRDVKRTISFFAISLALALITVLSDHRFNAHRVNVPVTIPVGGFLSRLVLGGLSGTFYFARFFWPWRPSPMYPQWNVASPLPWQFLPWPLLAGVIYSCWKNRLGWGRHVLLGLGFFFLFLAPFLGFHKISYMRYTWVMDHFLYIPMIGLIGLIVAGFGRLFVRLPESARPLSLGPVIFGMLLLAHESHAYAAIFSNQEAHYTYTIRLYPDARSAREDLGQALMDKGETARAIEQFEDTVKRYPDYVDAHYSLGTALMEANQWPEAAEEFKETIRLDPRHAAAYDNLGATLLMMGRTEESIERFRQAIAITDFAQPHNDMGNAFFKMGRMEDSIAEFRKALALSPDVARVHDNLGIVLARLRRIPEAAEQFEAAMKIDPGDATARSALERLKGDR